MDRGDAMSGYEPAQGDQVWTCPSCGRAFAQAQAAHDCRGRSRADYAATTLFASSAPQVYDLFLRYTALVAALGPVEIKVERTQIDFCDGALFAVARPGRKALMAGMIFSDLDNRERFVSIEQQEDGSWLHTVRVTAERDLDADLAGWLARAHREARQRHGFVE